MTKRQVVFGRAISLISAMVISWAAGQAWGAAVTDPSAGPEERLRELASGGDLLEAKLLSGEIPVDPAAAAWKNVDERELVLVHQTSIAPKGKNPRKLKLRVRAAHNQRDLGLWLSWEDAARNDQVTLTEAFGDAVAVEFPSVFKGAAALPYIGMGSKDRPVNVWQWKASWQLDIDKGFQGVDKAYKGRVPGAIPLDFRTGETAGASVAQSKKHGPVENLLAEGFGTITSIDAKGITGKGVWDGKRWTVVLRRSLKGTAPGEPSFAGVTPVSFAVWEGGQGERNGTKAITRWRFLKLERRGIPAALLADLESRPIAGADPGKGKVLIQTLRCFQCHVIPGFSDAPSMAGPDLTNAGVIHRPEYLLESIREPSAVVLSFPGYSGEGGESTMPKYDAETLPAADYKHIAAYLGSLE